MRTTALLCCLAAALPAQAPKGQVAFAAGAATSTLSGISWLCSAYLPSLPQWPQGLGPDQSIAVRIDDTGLHIGANAVELPVGTIAVGSFDLPGGVRAFCSCSTDGAEDWYVPENAVPPPSWGVIVDLLRARDIDRAHTIDLAVVVGHLLGPIADGDGRSLQIGAALCGDVTWQAWRSDGHVRVRGRSDGGLTIPAALLLAAADIGGTDGPGLPMRAFAARDGDRAEALRQLSRAPLAASRETLLAMLHGNDELRLTAIDSLVRLHAVADLPRIVAAATPSLPLTTTAACDAVAALWADATQADRDRTQMALAQSPVAELRAITPRGTGQPGPDGSVYEVPWRVFGALLLLGFALFPFWLRERARANAIYG